MIKVENLSYGYPQKDLYDKISFTLEEGQHCAFIGSSGSGKSTLADILRDPEPYMYEGLVEIDLSRKVGYVSQFSQVDPTDDTTVFNYIGETFIGLQSEITAICDEMATATELDELLVTYQERFDAFEALGGDGFESKIVSQLNLAGLTKHRDMKVSDLSGGEFKLVQVIKEMLTGPELIIMDEPDVFLDFENLNALKQLINVYKRTLLIITHNRYLLDHCFDMILHLEDQQVRAFNGRFIDYNFELLQTKIELQELALADDEELLRNDIMIEKLREHSARYDDVANGKALKARVKIQERLQKNRINAPFVEMKQPEINLKVENPLDELLAIKVEDYSVSFDETVLEQVGFEIMATDKVAIIGGNGTGKTTLLKAIKDGSNDAIEIHPDVDLSYLSQIQGEILNEAHTIVEEFFDLGFESVEAIQTYLEGYGFHMEGIHQKIGSLSGGEKNILQVAKVAHSKSNMLLLDEPMSHLDTYAQIALEHALEAYKGGVIMVSHDYYSIVNCMDYVLIIEDKKIRKTKIKKFKRMIFANHFDKEYMALEEKKKAVEVKIAKALKEQDFEHAKVLLTSLEALIGQM